jgi:hypothetical protein
MTVDYDNNHSQMKRLWDKTWDMVDENETNPLIKAKSIIGKEMPVIDPKQSNYDKFITKSTIESLDKETAIVAASQDTALVHADYSETMIDQLFIQTDAELQKGDKADHEKIYQQVRKIVTWLMHKAGIIDQHYANEQSFEVIIHVKKLKDSYNNWLGLAVTVVFAGLQVASGGMGVGGALAGAGDAFTKIATGLGTVGGAGNLLTGIFNQRSEGSRVIIQFDLEEVKRHRDQKFEGARKNDQSKSQAIQSADQGEYIRHKMFGEQTGSTG